MSAQTIYFLIAAVTPSITVGITGLADIELVPNPPPPYFGGETLTVDVWLHSNDVSSHDLRFVQLDVRPVPTPVRLIAGGAFTQIGSASALRIAELKDGQWAPIGADGSGANQAVLAIAQFDDGSGPALYFGGAFEQVQDCDGCPLIQANYIAKWDGASFQPVGTGLSWTVRALAVHDDGSGAALYAGGSFVLSEPGIWSSRIAKWDGVAWQAVGFGLNYTVRALAEYHEGAGAFLVAGGAFWHAWWEPMLSIAKWNGLAFEPVGDELIQDVYTLTVYDDGGGEALYAGGLFSESLTQPLGRIAKLSGNTWQPVGGGVDGYGVISSTVFNSAGGDVLVVGGSFDEAGAIPANNIAKWDGTTWSSLGDGTDGIVEALATFDDGTGPALFAGGNFHSAGGNSHDYMAKWDGAVWSSAGGGVDSVVLALEAIGLPDLHYSPNFDFAPEFELDPPLYFQSPSLPVPVVFFTVTTPVPGVVTLDALGSVHIGSLGVDLPTEWGTYILDVMNTDDTRPDFGARIGFGFGTAGDEPVTTWSAETGELTGGRLLLDVVPPPPVVIGAGARYLAITPPAGPDPIAILVTPACSGGGGPKYVGAVTQISPHGHFAVLVDDPNDAAFLKPAKWGGTVHVTGVDVTPSTSYDVQTESLAGVLSASANGTTWLWGDVDNNEVANFADVQQIILAFQGNFANVTFAGADLAPPISIDCFAANRVINANDWTAAIKAFQGEAYPCPACPP